MCSYLKKNLLYKRNAQIKNLTEVLNALQSKYIQFASFH